MIACHLMNGNLKGVTDHIKEFNTFTYSPIPRHVQEALTLMAALTPKFDLDLLKKMVDPVNYKRFIEYRQILIKHKGDKKSARSELQRQFGDSYWYYLMFVKPDSRQPESQNEYQ